MKVIPLGERLLIKPIKEEKKTEGGIVLPDSAKEKTHESRSRCGGKDRR
ncbi:10 kDa chaperonin [Thermotoga neapolitana DSM 4359]|uniref:10 kDa chaperonin n=1 Tax=Thermotoga neapolitana (strain ATCC 49049 / DSM 4359 / NBRC 107923 / NS-E) TaxID=309803 RepID=B9KBE6_THENN|nr:10 kDa chaperonin [Thermotoga neapolitana DSM 4359]